MEEEIKPKEEPTIKLDENVRKHLKTAIDELHKAVYQIPGFEEKEIPKQPVQQEQQRIHETEYDEPETWKEKFFDYWDTTLGKIIIIAIAIYIFGAVFSGSVPESLQGLYPWID